MDERCAGGWGEKDFELTIPLNMDRKPVRKPQKPPQKKKKSVDDLLLFGMKVVWFGLIFVLLIAGWLV